MAKKWMAALAALMLLTGCLSAFAEEAAALPDTLTVAVTTPMTGNFFTALWGNASSDVDVRILLHGCNLVEWDGANGMFTANSQTVESLAVTQDAATGDRTYTLVLRPGLRYSDGSPITAWDYAFSVLLTMAPEMAAIGGKVRPPLYLSGCEQYLSGEAQALAGVRVIAEDQLAFTVRGEYLPYFYELGLLNCVPYPIAVIAPGVRVADDGQGVYLTNADPDAEAPAFTAELLAATILDETNGYRTHPAVVSGPYTLASYSDGVAVFDRNPYSALAPKIEHLVFRSLSQEELIPALERGEVGLLNKVSDMAVIQAGQQLASEHPDAFTFVNYPRTGLSMLSFNADHEAVADKRVRQAIALLIDRDAFAAQTVGGYGQRVDGFYGLGQWMFRLLSGTVPPPVQAQETEDAAAQSAYETALAEWAELSLESLPAYERDPQAAAALLEEAGWTPDEATGLRVRDGETLSLRLAYPTGSLAAPALEALLPDMLAEGGISLTLEAVPMAELLPQYYHMAASDYDLFFMATNFDLLYDPSNSFVTDEAGNHIWAAAGLADEALYEAAVAMRATEPGDLLSYCKAWLRFEAEFEDALPAIPLYSNVYFDFHTAWLQDYQIASNVSWSTAIPAAWFGEPAAAETAEENDGLVFDD